MTPSLSVLLDRVKGQMKAVEDRAEQSAGSFHRDNREHGKSVILDHWSVEVSYRDLEALLTALSEQSK